MIRENGSKNALLVRVRVGIKWFPFGKKKKFMVMDSYCLNPDCPCRSVRLTCREVDKHGDFVEGGIQFAFSLSLDKWFAEQIDAQEEIKGHVKYFVDTFLKKLSPRIKQMFQDNYEEARNPSRRMESFAANISMEDIDSGLCAGYNDIFGDKDALSPPFLYDYRDDTYYFYDRYCINPECNCKESVLTVYCESTAELIKKEYFVIRLPFNKRKGYRIEKSRCSRNMARKIFKSWLIDNPDIIGILQERYNRVKDAGRYVKEKKRLME